MSYKVTFLINGRGRVLAGRTISLIANHSRSVKPTEGWYTMSAKEMRKEALRMVDEWNKDNEVAQLTLEKDCLVIRETK